VRHRLQDLTGVGAGRGVDLLQRVPGAEARQHLGMPSRDDVGRRARVVDRVAAVAQQPVDDGVRLAQPQRRSPLRPRLHPLPGRQVALPLGGRQRPDPELLRAGQRGAAVGPRPGRAGRPGCRRRRTAAGRPPAPQEDDGHRSGDDQDHGEGEGEGHDEL
jgi:hypothetical protein